MAQKNVSYFSTKQKGVERNHQIIIKKMQKKKKKRRMRTTPRVKDSTKNNFHITLHFSVLSYSIYILIKMLLYFHTKEMTVVEKDKTGMATE